jgi:hypothetical protein
MAGSLPGEIETVDNAVREGRFQRWLALVAAGASAMSGLEVAYEHYRGSYSRRVMYTPVALSAALTAAGVAGFCDARAARTVLPAVSLVTLGDGVLGLYFHVRGIARKPGGWRLPVTNMVMGPPVFAPLLFGISAYLGLLASFLQRSDDGAAPGAGVPMPAHPGHWAHRLGLPAELIDFEQDVREGRFQRQMAVATMLSAALSGFEAWYSHDKDRFRFPVQYVPLAGAALLMAAAGGAIANRRAAHTWLPAASALAIASGAAGFYYHVRGVARRPGGSRKLFYNIVYGPPVFAPLLFAASGFLGLLASLLRREGDA